MSRTQEAVKGDARLVRIWHDAAISKEGIYLPFGAEGKKSLNKAITMRHLLYRVRKSMEKAGHEWNNLAQQCKISVLVSLKDGKEIAYSHRQRWANESDITLVRLHIVPFVADTSVDEALAAAGYGMPSAPEIDL